MQFQLHSFAESGHSYKVALALHFAKADWEQVFIDFFRGETRSEVYKKEINSMAEVPVLQDGDKKISRLPKLYNQRLNLLPPIKIYSLLAKSSRHTKNQHFNNLSSFLNLNYTSN